MDLGSGDGTGRLRVPTVVLIGPDTHLSWSIFVYDQGQIGWSHLLKGQISVDWEAVINAERIETGLQAHPRANVKVIREIIPIVLNLWRRKCEVAFGKTKEQQ